MRYIHMHTTSPFRPYDKGVNVAKRIARLADERAQKLVLATFGPGHARSRLNHQELVRQRHAAYRAA